MKYWIVLVGIFFSIQGNCPEPFDAQAGKVELSLDSVDEIDYFIVVRSAVKQPVTISFYYKKDRVGSGQDLVRYRYLNHFRLLPVRRGPVLLCPAIDGVKKSPRAV